jgi:hypothetical protein
MSGVGRLDIVNEVKSPVVVAAADCSVCGKDNVYKRVPRFHRELSPTCQVRITCKDCGHLFFVPEIGLAIRRKTTQDLDAEYGGVKVLYEI